MHNKIKLLGVAFFVFGIVLQTSAQTGVSSAPTSAQNTIKSLSIARRVVKPSVASTRTAMGKCLSTIPTASLSGGDVDSFWSGIECVIREAGKLKPEFLSLLDDSSSDAVVSTPTYAPPTTQYTQVSPITQQISAPTTIAVTPINPNYPITTGGSMCGSNPNWRSYSWKNGQQSCILAKYDKDSSYKAFIDKQNDLVQGSCGWNNGGDDTKQETFGVCFPSSSAVSYPSGSADTSCERISKEADCAKYSCGTWNSYGWNPKTNSVGNCNFGGSTTGGGMMSGTNQDWGYGIQSWVSSALTADELAAGKAVVAACAAQLNKTSLNGGNITGWNSRAVPTGGCMNTTNSSYTYSGTGTTSGTNGSCPSGSYSVGSNCNTNEGEKRCGPFGSTSIASFTAGQCTTGTYVSPYSGTMTACNSNSRCEYGESSGSCPSDCGSGSIGATSPSGSGSYSSDPATACGQGGGAWDPSTQYCKSNMTSGGSGSYSSTCASGMYWNDSTKLCTNWDQSMCTSAGSGWEWKNNACSPKVASAPRTPLLGNVLETLRSWFSRP